MMKYPDKFIKKTTITNCLRKFIIDIPEKVLNISDAVYLEIGCDECYTTLSVCSSYKKLYAIDLDANRLKVAKKLIVDELCDDKIILIHGTSKDIITQHYDVILIDANHSYDDVKLDFQNVISNNTANKFLVIFHDYGLNNAGVKKFVNETFDDNHVKFCGLKDNWNPLGSTISDWEAAYVIIQKETSSS